MTQHRVFVTGASGFVGSEIVNQLLAKGMNVVALARRWESAPERAGLQRVSGDLLGGDAWKESLAGCDALIHLVGIIRENLARGITFGGVHVHATQRVLTAAKEFGISRYLHMSALGTRPQADSLYHRSKQLAEEEVTSSKLAWTIFRPSVIHGPRGEFTRMMASWARRKLPLMPYFGHGLLGTRAASVQPVYVGDVARAFVEAITLPATMEKAYEVAGTEILAWPEFYRRFAAAIGRPGAIPLAVPAWFARLLTSTVPERLLPFTEDQLIMALEDHAADPGALLADFGWRPQSFSQSVKAYAAEV